MDDAGLGDEDRAKIFGANAGTAYKLWPGGGYSLGLGDRPGAGLFANDLLDRSAEAGDIVDDQRAAVPPD